VNTAELIDTTIVVISGLTSVYFSKQQNEIFREQNKIFAAQAGIKMPETLRKNKFELYWPTIAAAFIAVAVWVVVSHLQVSIMFAWISSFIILLGFGAGSLGGRSKRREPLSEFPFAQSGIAKPQHNVQCLGVRIVENAADIGFVNVEIPNREIISFHQARLKIRYSLAVNQIETVFPARWIGSDDAEISVEFVPQYAVLAVYIGNEWYGVEIKESRRKLKSLPTAELRIEATLIGEGNLSIVPLTGSLALRKDGKASFSKDV
jgi:hypothetical protein